MRPLTALACTLFTLAAPLPATARSVDLAAVCFTPGEDCAGLIVRAIDGAARSIRVQAYAFTSHPIAGALIAAHERGVDVQLIVDRSEARQKYSEAGELAASGITTLIDHAAGIAHNKVIIIDGERVSTGSFNFTASAQSRNVENVVEIDDSELAGRFLANWKSRLPHTTPFAAP